MADNPFSSDWLAGGRDERLRPQGTLSYVSGSTDEPLRFITLSQQLDKTVSRHGPRDAAVFDAENLRLSQQRCSWAVRIRVCRLRRRV